MSNLIKKSWTDSNVYYTIYPKVNIIGKGMPYPQSQKLLVTKIIFDFINIHLSRAAVAEQTRVPLLSRTVFTGWDSGLNHVSAKIRYLLLFREFQLKVS